MSGNNEVTEEPELSEEQINEGLKTAILNLYRADDLGRLIHLQEFVIKEN